MDLKAIPKWYQTIHCLYVWMLAEVSCHIYTWLRTSALKIRLLAARCCYPLAALILFCWYSLTLVCDPHEMDLLFTWTVPTPKSWATRWKEAYPEMNPTMKLIRTFCRSLWVLSTWLPRPARCLLQINSTTSLCKCIEQSTWVVPRRRHWENRHLWCKRAMEKESHRFPFGDSFDPA